MLWRIENQLLYSVCKRITKPKVWNRPAQIEACFLPGQYQQIPGNRKQKNTGIRGQGEATETEDLRAGEDGEVDDRVAAEDQERTAEIHASQG